LSQNDARTITLKVGQAQHPDGLQATATHGIPLPRGALSSPDQIEVIQLEGENMTGSPGQSLPCQGRALSRYEDGTIRWLLLDFMAPVHTGPAAKTRFAYLIGHSTQCQFRFGEGVKPTAFPGAMKVEEDAGKITITSRRMRLVVPKKRFRLIESLQIDGKEMISAEEENDLVAVSPDGKEFQASLDPTYQAVMEEQGPLRSVIKMTGRHTSLNGKTMLDYVVRIRVYAESPSLGIEHQFINCEEPEEGLDIASIGLVFSLALDGQIRRAVRHYDVGYNRKNRIVEFPGRADVRINLDWNLLADASVVGDSVDKYPYDIRTLHPPGMIEAWLGVGNGTAGVVTQVEEASVNFPKGMVSEGNRLTYWMWPAWAETLHLPQGMGKTHGIVMTFYTDSPSPEEREERIRACMSPVTMTVPFSWVRSTGVFGLDHVIEPCGDEHPRVEALLDTNFQKRAITPWDWRFGWGVGMLNYGDAVDDGYTVSYDLHGFGLRGDVWNNNEYDFIHSAMIQYFRTGSGGRLHEARIAARHMSDVDFIHYSQNPLRHHGCVHHSVNHTSGTVVPSHMFAEGMVEYYCATGDEEVLSTAIKMGDHLLRTWDENLWMAEDSAREIGWPLISFAALYEVTGEKRFLEGAWKAIRHFLKREEETEGTYNTGNDMFTNLIGWKSIHRQTGEESLRKLIIEQTDKEMSGRYGFRNVRLLELLEYCHFLTGDRKYVEFGWKSLIAELDTNRYWVQYRTHKPIGSRFRGLIHFFRLLQLEGKLDRFDYPGLDDERPALM